MARENQTVLPEIMRIGFYDSKTYYSNVTKPPEKVSDDFIIEFYTEATGGIMIDGIEYLVKTDSVTCAKPRQKRRCIPHFACYFIHLNCESGVYHDMLSQLPVIFSLGKAEEYYEEIKKIIYSINSETGLRGELKVNFQLTRFLYRLMCDSELFKRKAHISSRTDLSVGLRGAEYIDQHFTEQINLDDIASNVGLSPIYFHKLFTVINGKTPHDYLTEKRIGCAKQMLQATNLPIVDIAFESGFTSQSYFNFAFKKQVGMTPGRFRKNSHINDIY